MEQTLNPKFEDLRIQFSNLQQAFDEKTAENLRLQETVAETNRRNEELAAELRAESEQKKRIRSIARDPNIFDESWIHVILFGGKCNGNETDSICLSNSKENKWINSPLKLPSALSCHESVILNDEIYIFGGENRSSLKSTYKLGENREWIKLADMNMERSHFGSLVFDDEIWVFGGWDGEYGRYHKTVEKYNPQTNSWTLMPEMNQFKDSFAVSIINGKFYISGGYGGNYPGKCLDEIEVFDPEKNKWEFFCNMPFGLGKLISTVDGTNLIIIGGKKYNEEIRDEVWKIDVLDPKKEWKKMPNLQQSISRHIAVKMGYIFKIEYTDSVEIFDGQKWKEGPKLPEMRSGFSSILLTSKNEKKFLQLLL